MCSVDITPNTLPPWYWKKESDTHKCTCIYLIKKKQQQQTKIPSGSWYVDWQCPRLRECSKNENVTEKRSFEGECDNFEDKIYVKDLMTRHTSKPERAIFLLECIAQKPLVKKPVYFLEQHLFPALKQYHRTPQNEFVCFFLCQMIRMKRWNFRAVSFPPFLDRNNRRTNIGANYRVKINSWAVNILNIYIDRCIYT